MANKEWYILRQSGERNWSAYQIDPTHLDYLGPGVEYRGPFDTLLDCIMAANEREAIESDASD